MPVAMQCPAMAPSATKYGFCAAASACDARLGVLAGTGGMGVKVRSRAGFGSREHAWPQSRGRRRGAGLGSAADQTAPAHVAFGRLQARTRASEAAGAPTSRLLCRHRPAAGWDASVAAGRQVQARGGQRRAA